MENPVKDSYEELLKWLDPRNAHPDSEVGVRAARKMEYKLRFDEIIARDRQSTAAERQAKALVRATWALAFLAVLQLVLAVFTAYRAGH